MKYLLLRALRTVPQISHTDHFSESVSPLAAEVPVDANMLDTLVGIIQVKEQARLLAGSSCSTDPLLARLGRDVKSSALVGHDAGAA